MKIAFRLRNSPGLPSTRQERWKCCILRRIQIKSPFSVNVTWFHELGFLKTCWGSVTTGVWSSHHLRPHLKWEVCILVPVNKPNCTLRSATSRKEQFQFIKIRCQWAVNCCECFALLLLTGQPHWAPRASTTFRMDAVMEHHWAANDVLWWGPWKGKGCVCMNWGFSWKQCQPNYLPRNCRKSDKKIK